MTSSLHDQTTAPAGPEVDRQLDGIEQHLASLQEQVQRLQRLASLGTVSAMLAHEFNNMLTPVISYARYAAQRDDPDLMRAAVEKTLKHGDRMTTLCERILGLASDDSMGPTDVQLEPLAADAIGCLGRDLDKDRIELTIDIPDGLTVRAHAGSLQQVLFNLVLNARQAMLDHRGRLTISARPRDDGRVEINVSDSGPGIKAEDLDRVFEPFFSTKRGSDRPDRRGVGLGLTICRQLIEEQDGEISVESRTGQGATFTIMLPGGTTP